MALEQFGIDFEPGLNLYVVFWNGDTVIRQASGSWVAATGGNSDIWPLTEVDLGRADIADYRLATPADLARMSPGIEDARGLDVVARFYQRVGGSANTATDPLIFAEPFVVQFGARGPGTAPPVLDFALVPGYRKDLTPKVASFWVQVLANGQSIDLNDISGDHVIRVTVRKEGEGADLFVAESDTVDASGRILVTYNTPGYVIDRSYWCQVDYLIDAEGDVLLSRAKPFLGA